MIKIAFFAIYLLILAQRMLVPGRQSAAWNLELFHRYSLDSQRFPVFHVERCAGHYVKRAVYNGIRVEINITAGFVDDNILKD
jgi:hypothetical protein